MSFNASFQSVVTTIPHLPDVVVPANELPSLVACNPTIAYPYISWVFQVTSERATSGMAHQASSACLDALKRLSPTLPSFDVFGRLLRDNTYITAVLNDNPADAAEITVAQLIRLEVLGTFLLNAIEWIEKAENEEKEGLVSDDRASKAVQNVGRLPLLVRTQRSLWFFLYCISYAASSIHLLSSMSLTQLQTRIPPPWPILH